ncbi:MAG: cation diffusion facilitator family transporter [Alphaproteobacteria bacterium]|nr:cation diffusion facilitator family transporter [Alphaproteobacteria bacterium]
MHAHSNNERRIFWAAVLTGGFMLAELFGGLLSGSLALLADAGHMLTDFASLALAWFAFRLSRRPADWKRTYGFDRFQILVAFINGVALVFVALWIFFEAADRLMSPVRVLGGPVVAIAGIGLFVNLGAFWLLHGADRANLNVQGALFHVVGDLLGSVAALAAGAVILTTGWTPIDPILSVLVGLLILRSAATLVRDAGHILLEGAPKGVDTREIGADLVAEIAVVEGVHHIHAWSITQERQMLTLHAQIAEGVPAEAATAAIKARLRDRFGVSHATVEVERAACADEG